MRSTLGPGGTLCSKAVTALAAIGGSPSSTKESLEVTDLTPHLAKEYSFIRKLEQGAMSSIYLVQENATGDQSVIYLFDSAMLRDRGAVERFDQEAVVSTSLHHPNLVASREYAIPTDGSPYILMESVSGIDLASILYRHEKLLVEEVLDVFMQITEALVYTHSRGITHRDLKASNVIVSLESGWVKLVGFGVANIIRPSKKIGEPTDPDQIVGTPDYLSPEQCRGEAADERSDIYSLGCVMYESLAGKPPFKHRAPVKTILDHLNKKPKPFSEEVTSQQNGKALEGLVMKCLEKSPRDRYQSAAELLSDLQAIHQNRAGTLRWSRVAKSIRTPKAMVTMSALLTVLCAAAAWSVAVTSNHKQPVEQAANIPPSLINEVLPPNAKAPTKALFANKNLVAVDFMANQPAGILGLVVNDENVAALRDLPKLRFLNLTDRPVTATLFVGAPALPLQDLNLEGTNFSDNNIDSLSRFKALQRLNLGQTAIGTGALKAIGELPDLQVLRLSGTKVKDPDLTYLKANKNLRALDLANCHITDEGCSTLAELPIEVLDLQACPITDKGLQTLGASKTIRYLSLESNPRITTAGLKSLGSLPLLVLILIDSKVCKTPDLSCLSGLKDLRLLVLDPGARGIATNPGLPNCHLVLDGLLFNTEIFNYAPQITLFHLPRWYNIGQERYELMYWNYRVGRTLEFFDFSDLAIPYLTEAIKLSSGIKWTDEQMDRSLPIDALRIRSEVYARSKQYDKAADDLKQALKLAPKDPNTLRCVQFLMMAKRTNSAVQSYNEPSRVHDRPYSAY
ncbi:MAG TPA: protein kinase [Planktothrix sp.]|jgi:serine/threonine protein kinase